MEENTKDLSGPAFPIVETNETVSVDPGLTKRDYFAAKAIQEMVWLGITDDQVTEAAETAYKIADAMLQERDR